MEKICTTIEQSKKLIELGIDVNTADMYYEEVCNLPKAIVGNYILHNQCMEDKDYKKLSNPVLSPAWSLTALLELMPNNKVTSTTVTRGGWNIEPVKYLDIWFAEYETEKHDNDFSLSTDSPIDAAFEMICWLKEKNLL